MASSSQEVNFRRSIAFRYLLIVCSALLAGQLLFGAFQIRQIYQQQHQTLAEQMNRQALFLSSVSPEPILELDFLRLETLMRQTSQNPDVVYSGIVNPGGQPLTRFISRTHPLIATQPPDLIAEQNIVSLATALESHSRVRQIRTPIILAGRPLGEVWLGYSLERTQQSTFASEMLILLGVVLLTATLAMVTVVVFTRRVRQPLQQLVTFAQNLEHGQLDQRAPIERTDEIGHLGRSLNAMADRLQSTLHGLEQRVQERTAELSAALEQQRAQAQALVESRQAQQELDQLVMELSVPVIPVTNDVLVVPLVGNLNARRASEAQNYILEQIELHRSRFIIMDITGVPIIDTATAQMLLQTAAATRLLGTSIMIVGMRPEVAQTMVSLGINFAMIKTQATLQEGLRSLGFHG